MRPVVLLILDGYGIGPEGRGNAIAQARKPNLDFVEKKFQIKKGNGFIILGSIKLSMPCLKKCIMNYGLVDRIRVA